MRGIIMEKPDVSALVLLGGGKGRPARDTSDHRPMTLAYTLKEEKIGMPPIEMYETWKACFGGNCPAQTLFIMLNYAIQKKREEAGLA